MRERVSLYFVSDRAYDVLTSIGVEYGYIRPGMLRMRGMSEFIAALSESTFLDTRPPSVIERHEQQVASGHAPIWSTHYDRRARSLKLTEDCQINLLKLALSVDIIREEPYLIGGPSRMSPVSVIGYVLESIGLRWLTPRDIPTKVYEIERQRTEEIQSRTHN